MQRNIFATVVTALLFTTGLSSSNAAILPELPRTFIDTTYAPGPGATISVPAGGSFQNALNSAVLGDTIVLQAGATYTGPFTLPNKTTGSGWIYIRSSAYSSLPAPGNRVSPLNAANMPKIVISASASNAAIRTANSAHHFRFVGIEFAPVPGSFIYNLIDLGNSDTSITTVPKNLVFDRCYVHGDSTNPAQRGRRGIAMNGNSIAVIDSYISNFVESGGGDTQALWSFQGDGPFKIVNNYLEASSENVLFGGNDPSIPNSVPSDIEVRRNHFFKPLSWIRAGYNVKNHLEFKNAQRVLVEGNVFENTFLDAQGGHSLLITPRNQSNHAPWSITQDITIRLNRFINVGQGLNISGRDDTYMSQISRRILVENNVIQVTGLNGADGRVFNVGGGPIDVTIRHNTGFCSGNSFGIALGSPLGDAFDFRDNLMANCAYGFIGDKGAGIGTSALAAYFVTYVFTKNVIFGPFPDGTGTYPAGNFFPTSSTAVGFVNYAAGNFALSASSAYRNAGSDGKDIGADISALVAAGGGGISAGLPAPTNAKVQ